MNILLMAPPPDGGGGGGLLSTLIMFAIIGGIVYLFVRMGKKKKSVKVRKVKRPDAGNDTTTKQ